MNNVNSTVSNYKNHSTMSDDQVLEMAAEIIETKYLRGDSFNNPAAVKEFLQCKLANYEREVFAVLLLDSQNSLIEYKELFFGTINSANIHPREVLKIALQHNAAAVMFAHNHPSGNSEPSNADKQITQKLKGLLEGIDIRVLDHIVVGKDCVSFAERGLL